MIDTQGGLPLEGAELVDWAVVMDRRGHGVLYVLTRDNLLLAFPGRQIESGFDFDKARFYPIHLTDAQQRDVHPARGQWSTAALRAIVQAEALRVRGARWN